MRADLGKRGERALIALDRDHLLCSLRQERAGEAARARSDLDDGDAGERPGCAGDLAGQIEVEQEILAKRLARVETVTRDDLAQRRQSVGAERHRVRRSASLSAAIRLARLGIPLRA